MEGFTHYSLFGAHPHGEPYIRHQPLPEGGVWQVMRDAYAVMQKAGPGLAVSPTGEGCYEVTFGTLMPDARALSFEIHVYGKQAATVAFYNASLFSQKDRWVMFEAWVRERRGEEVAAAATGDEEAPF